MIIVLIVDKSNNRISKISKHLRTIHKTLMVLSANNDRQAISICKENTPDIVFINNNLGESSVFGLIKELRTHGLNPYFVLLLESISEKNIKKAINQNISDIIFTSDKKNFLNNLDMVFYRFKNLQDHKRVIEMAISGKAFRESEERFQSLVKFSSDIILILKSDGTIHDISPSVERILGYKSKRLFGKNIFKFVHPKDVKNAQEKFAETFQKLGVPIYCEVRIKHSNDSWVDFEIIANNLTENPSIKGVVINARDITKRKKAEKEIKKREAKYRSLVEDAGTGIVSVDTEGNINYVNRALCKIIGYTERELMGKNFAEFLHEDDLEVILELFEAVLKRPKEKPELEFRVKHKDGHIVYFHAKPTISSFDQKISGLNAIMTDITGRRLAEEAKHKSEKLYKLLANNVDDIIFILDTDLNFSYISPSF
ncbi:MAG: PAS domain S-box protein, partial [Candidatus Thorarchaeota archaeon]